MNKTIKILFGLIILLVLANIFILYYFISESHPVYSRQFSPDNPGRDFRIPRNNRLSTDEKEQLARYRIKMRDELLPYQIRIRDLDLKLYQELLKNDPDKENVFSMTDSLNQVQNQMRIRALSFILNQQDSLTQLQKRILFHDVLNKHIQKHNRRIHNRGERK